MRHDVSPPPTEQVVDDDIEAIAPVQRVRPRRRPWLILAGVAMAAACGTAAGTLYLQAGQRTEVLMLAADVPYGEEVRSQDLASVRLALDPAVLSVPAEQMSTVVGRPAAADLAAGTLLTPDATRPTVAPASGKQLVAVAVTPAQMPAQGLRTGDAVDVVDVLPEGGQGEDRKSPPTIPGEVLHVGREAADGTRVIDVQTAATDGAALAARVADGSFAIVVNNPGVD
jgi:hypothetical protein